MLEALIFLTALSLGSQVYLIWLIEKSLRASGKEPPPGDEGPKPMHAKALKVREGERRNRVISRNEEQEAELEEANAKG
jgi:threonine/homoserine/homoserine lactone efflux protein